MTGQDYKNELVLEIRDNSRLSQKEFGEIFDVHENTIARIEKGTAASFEILRKIADYADIDVKELLRSSKNLAAETSAAKKFCQLPNI